MTPEQMRELADELDKYVGSPTRASYYPSPVLRAADFLRQCAEQRPDGWQLVPVEPTEAMKSAGGHVNSEWLNDDAPLCESRYAMPMDGVWSAMLAAAPAVPQADALPVALVRAYNAGYMAGHHDTVEGGFVDIHPSDMDTYHADVVAELGLPAAPQAEPKREPVSDSRPCTCHPDDNPPVPCAQKYALSECRAVHGEPTEAQIKARDALLDFISENGTASEGVQHYLDRYVRAALAAKDGTMNKWLGPYKTGEEALDALRRTIAEIIGADPEKWPDHSNAPLAIAAGFGLMNAELKAQAPTRAARDVLDERKRQVKVEGWTEQHDDEHGAGELARAAAAYALDAGNRLDPHAVTASGAPSFWPWHGSRPREARWWKPADPRRNLVKAGALILAEIERFDRAALAAKDE